MSGHERLPTQSVTRHLLSVIFDHSQCGQTFLPFSFAPQMTSPSPGNRPTSPLPSPIPIADHFPNRSLSATPPPLLSSARHCSLPSLTRSIDHERRTPPPVSVEPRSSSSPRNFSLPSLLLRKQLLFSLPHVLTLSLMVLLTISVSHSIVHHSRTVLQHSAHL